MLIIATLYVLFYLPLSLAVFKRMLIYIAVYLSKAAFRPLYNVTDYR
jgi:hypothetical protein